MTSPNLWVDWTPL